MNIFRIILVLFFSSYSTWAEEAPISAQDFAKPWHRDKMVKEWREYGTWPRYGLVQLLRHESISIRCHAFDLLEDLAGQSFDYDPWMSPADQAQDVMAQWESWAKDERHKPMELAELTEDVADRQLSIILSGDKDARARAMRFLLPFGVRSLDILQHYISTHPELASDELKSLRQAQYFITLSPITKELAENQAYVLAQGGRNDIISNLQSLHEYSLSILPILETFISHGDPLVRETAVDLFITIGGEQALNYILPALLRETDHNVLQVALKRAQNYPVSSLAPLVKKCIWSENEDLTSVALETFGLCAKEANSSGLSPVFFFTDDEFLRLIHDSRWRVKQVLLEAISRSNACINHSQRNIQYIYDLLQDENPSVASSALTCLFAYKPDKFAEHLNELAITQPMYVMPAILFSSEYNHVLPTSVFQALKRLPPEMIISVLQDTKSSGVSMLMLSTLPSFRPVLDFLFTHPNMDVRLASLVVATESFGSSILATKTILEALESPVIPLLQKENVLKKIAYDSSLSLLDDEYTQDSTEERASDLLALQKRFISYLHSVMDSPPSTEVRILRSYAALNLMTLYDNSYLPEIIRDYSTYNKEQKNLFEEAVISQPLCCIHLFSLVETVLKDNPKFSQAYTLDSYLSTLFRTSEDTDKNVIICNPPNVPKGVQISQGSISYERLAFIMKQFPSIFSSFLENKDNYTKYAKFVKYLLDQKVLNPNQLALFCIHDKDVPIPSGVSPAVRDLVMALREFPREEGDSLDSPDETPTEPTLISWANKWLKSSHDIVKINVITSLFSQSYLYYFYLPLKQDNSLCMALSSGNIYGVGYDSGITEHLAVESNPLTEALKKLEKSSNLIISIQASLVLMEKLHSCDMESLEAKLTKFISEHPLSEEGRKLGLYSSYTASLESIVSGIFNGRKKFTDDEVKLYKLAKRLFPNAYWPKEVVRTMAQIPGEAPSFGYGQNAQNQAVQTMKEQQEAFGLPNTKAHITVIFFEKTGCQECVRVNLLLQQLSQKFPHLTIETHSIVSAKDIEYNAYLCAKFGVLPKDRMIAPAVFMRDGVLLRDGLSENNLIRLALSSSREQKNPPSVAWYTLVYADTISAQELINERYASLSIGVVFLGGLLDGVNPCAFATLIFFLSYLQIARKRPTELFAAGMSFILAVFLTYFAIGLVFHSIMEIAQEWIFLKSYLDVIFFTLALLAALFSFRDAWRAYCGRLGDMSLTLPQFLRNAVRVVSRTQAKSPYVITAAFIAGVIISLIELACTGQVYAPIIYKIQQGAYAAIPMLLLYNIAFIFPLLLIFFLTWKGMKTQFLIDFQLKHTALIKFSLGILFLILAVFVLWHI